MIRINLLPIKQDRRREAARNQIVLGVIVVMVQIAAFVIMYLNMAGKIDTQQNTNSNIESDVKRIKAQISDHPAIIKEIEEFEKRQAAIDGLEEARTGPVYIMLEMSNILSKNGRPNIDNAKYQELIRLDPTAGYDENWDYRRLWITSFQEKSRSVVIKGQALTHEDVAEFLRRINLSRFFVTNELISTNMGKPELKLGKANTASMEPVVHFIVSGSVRYR
jgi:type IV pilus assembly protein PilN